MNLKIYKIRSQAKIPTRAHQLDAGMDLYYCPNDDKKLYNTKDFYIPPKVSRLLPTGLKIEIPYGFMLEIKNKSGIAHKRQLVVGACVIDPGYNGEIYINLHNIGAETQVIRSGDKVAQAVLIPIIHFKVQEVESDKFLNFNSKRGEGGFGSTGDK
jgi:dUTP pyrophosphatase